ncbi:rhodanese-like domain-containing protein [Streptomyces halobius]|uniref:CBS domain-containing protein n=1 Tax=Streptomyces halobius TaxID=2879846 RepID=A0ABY4LZP7_9ACTN|nr:rhodanese-like domain-containing protein [Streptomyces halobius]UQA90662.1 CBS domain-containing protein [Streptomyces halobius]
MPKRVERGEVQRLLAQGGQLVEVLPAADYDDEHIAGAINIPLRHLDREARERLDPERPVIVYCYDWLCDVSPRAAHRLEHLGFGQVYDYMPGKTDWLAAGLPRHGRATKVRRAGDIADPGVPTCDIDASPRDVAEQSAAHTGGFFVVLDEQRVVHGTLSADADELRDKRTIAQAMRPGPATVRANEPLEPLVERMKQKGVDAILVTAPEGQLLGLLTRQYAEQVLQSTA